MAVSFTLTRSTTRFHDSNGNGIKDVGELDFDFGETGVYDPGDILYTRINITNTGNETATGVTISDNFAGSSFVDASNLLSASPFLNISPIAGNDTFQAIGNTVLRVGTANTINGGESTFFAGNLTSNDVGSLTGDSIPGFQIDVVSNGVSTNGGRFNIFSDGTFNYVNDGTDTTLTTDSFSYKIRDVGFDGVINTADDLTSTATVTITFAEQSPGVAHRVWYVDSNAAAGGDGTSANPFQTMAPINGAANNGAVTGDLDQAGEYIYVENSGGSPVPVTGPITLENGQQLIGDGAALVVAGVTLATAGTNSTLTAASGTIVTLASGNTVAGLNIGVGTGSATGISGSSFGTLTVSNVALNTGGQALSLVNGAFSGSGFTSTDSDGGVNNVGLSAVTGTVNLGSGALAGATGTSGTGGNLWVGGGTATVNYSGTIGQATANVAAVNITGAHTTGTVTLSGNITATDGTGLQFNNADGTYNLGGVISLTGTGDAGIDIFGGSSGTFTFGTASNLATITNNSGGDAFVVDGVSGTPSNATVTFNGTITDNNGNAVSIDEHDGGTITFQNGSINSTGSGIDVTNSNGGTINFNSQVTLSTGANTAITLTANNGSATNFNPTGTGLDISTSSGSGIIASNAGTITIADSGTGNSIAITAGAGGTVAFSATGGTTIGAGGVTFDSIGQAGGTNGIVLNGTGTNAFTVLGDGSQTSGLYDRDGSGGTISGTTGHAIALTNANNVTIRQMNILNPTGAGSDGVNSNGGGSIKLQAVNIDAGADSGWEAINLGGANEFTHNSRVTDWQTVQSRGITVTNTNTNFTSFTISNALFTTSATGADGFLFDAEGATSGSVTVTNSEFTLIDDDAVQINNDGSGTINARVNNNNFHDADNTSGDGNNTVFLALAGSGTLNFEVINNDFTNLARVQALTGALAVNAVTVGQTGSRLNGFIEDNVFTNIFRRDAISFVIEASGGVQGTHTIEVENNSGTNIGLTAMRVLINSVAGGSVTATNLRYISNTFSNLGTSPLVTDDSRSGIEIETNYDNFASGGDLLTNILFQNNNITNNGSASGVSDTVDIANRAGNAGTNSTMNLTFLGNNFTNATGPFGIDILNSQGTSATGSGATINLDMNSDNISPNNTTTTLGAGGDINLRNNAPGGAFRIEDLGANPVTTFVSTRNSGDTVTNGSLGAAITSTGDVTMPTAPSAFIVAAAPPAPPADAEESIDGGLIDTPEVDNGGSVPAPAPAPAGPVVVDDGILSQAELDLIVDAAIARWAAAGASDAQIAAMRAVSVSVSDLAGLTLGQSNAGTIVLDSDAAGWRWFVDSTPGDDSEYAGAGTRLAAVDKLGLAGTRIDLLTVLTHELGHQIGLSDLSALGSSDELMYGTIGAGERRLPGSDDLAGAAGGPVAGAFAFAPVSLGSIPVGQTVIVEFRHVIDNPGEDRLVGAWTGQSTVDSDQSAPQNSNAESGNIDGLALTGLIYNDLNKDGLFNGGDTAAANVSLTLYADSNNDGNYDEGVDLYVGYNELGGGAGYQQGVDTPAAPGTGTPLTVSTNASGIYTFTALAPGDYIVRVNASNFQAGGALLGKTSHGSPVDPNTGFVDNDNNGEQFLIAQPGTYAASRAIRLDYGLENVAGPTGPALDTNDTLDLGFEAPNQPPAIAALQGDAATFVEGAATAVKIDQGTLASITDSDSPNFNLGSLTVAITGNKDSGEDELGIDTAVATGVTIASGTISVDGLAIGTVTGGGAGGSDIVIAFNTNDATPARVAKVLNALTYFNSDAINPSAAQRTVSITLVDGDGEANGGDDDSTVTTLVNVTPVNDAPAGTDNIGTLTTPEDTRLVLTAADFGFSDVDGNSFAGFVLTTVPGAGTLYIDIDGAGGSLGTAVAMGNFVTIADINAGRLVYVPNAEVSGNDTFTFQVRDNGGTLNSGVDTDGSANTIGIAVTAVIDNPTISNLQGDNVGFFEGSAPQYADAGSNASVSDPDSPNFEDGTLTVEITANEVAAEDVLAPGSNADFVIDANVIVYQGTPVANFAGGTGGDPLVFTFRAAATPSIVSAIMKLVNYENTNQTNPSTAQRTLTWTLTDGDGGSNAVTSTITVTGVNDAPTSADDSVTTPEDDAYTFHDEDFPFTDGDGNTLSGVRITELPATGQLLLNGNPVLDEQVISFADLDAGNLTYQPPVNVSGAPYASFKFKVIDTGNTDNGGANQSAEYTMSIDVTPDSAAPTFALDDMGPSATLNYTEGDPASVMAPDAQLSDSDSPDFDTGTLTVKFDANGEATDQLGIANQGTGAGQISVSGADVKYENVTIGTFTGGANGTDLVVTFNAASTPAAAQALARAITYQSTSQDPSTLSRTVNFTVTDGDGGSSQANAAVNVTATNDPPTVTAADTTVGGTEDTNLVFNAANLNAITVADVDGDSLTVTLTVLNGRLTLSQTTNLSVTGDGTGTVELTGSAADINAALEGLIYRGNLNYEGSDTLGVEVDDGTATDTENVAITLADDGFIDGDSGDNVLNGTPQRDVFRLQQGGNDTANGLPGNDSFYFGAAFTAADTVNGDDGFDVLILQGNYSAGVTFGTGLISNITGIDSISLFPGGLTTYGDTANNLYSYNLTMLNGNVAQGEVMKVNGSGLLAGENFTFNGSAETDGQFIVFGGKGVDNLTGGGLGDSFVFNFDRFGTGDSVNGGGGYDVVYLRGDYTIDFNAVGFAGSLANVESVGLLSFSDTNYAGGGDGEFDYSIVWNNAMLATGQTMTFNGSRLGSNETMHFDGTSETDGGKFRLWGGAADDDLRGGSGNDLIYGGNGGDSLRGGGGSDIFRYQSITESTSGGQDGIQDFASGDLIDLSFIDANTLLDGNQAFNFIGSGAFTNQAGQLRAVETSPGSNLWIVSGDVDGINGADFQISVVVTNGYIVSASDFVL